MRAATTTSSSTTTATLSLSLSLSLIFDCILAKCIHSLVPCSNDNTTAITSPLDFCSFLENLFWLGCVKDTPGICISHYVSFFSFFFSGFSPNVMKHSEHVCPRWTIKKTKAHLKVYFCQCIRFSSPLVIGYIELAVVSSSTTTTTIINSKMLMIVADNPTHQQIFATRLASPPPPTTTLSVVFPS